MAADGTTMSSSMIGGGRCYGWVFMNTVKPRQSALALQIARLAQRKGTSRSELCCGYKAMPKLVSILNLLAINAKPARVARRLPN